MRGLKDKCGIVTGGASGIAKAMCVRLAEEGCRVAIFDRNEELAEATAALIRRQGGSACAFAVDVTDTEAVARSVARAHAEWGAIDFLINGAGWDKPAPFLSTQRSDWARVIDINLVGPLNLHHAVCPIMRDAGGGRVINVASDSARTGASDVAVYSATKGGLISLTKSLAREFARHGILVNAISPGPTETPLFQSFVDGGPDGGRWRDAVARTIPLRRLAMPDDYAGLAAFLISDDASYITGQTISVSGGLTMV